ncbi:MAG: GTP-binding protein, partial [Planctomycetes bacterium]|nr:GTP-binding protein [Planctomycetota bacterium]
MSYASVAIVGRPNVGKSTLFNRLVGSRISIEAPTAGVTRDRILYPMVLEHSDSGKVKHFDLIDTGGIGIVDKQHLEVDVEKQIEFAIAQASALLFLVDVRDGVTPADKEIARRLRRYEKPVLLVANKADTAELEDMPPSFHELGFGDVLTVSAKHKRNMPELEDALVDLL